MTISFSLLATEAAARRGTLKTAHGVVQTPCFMATATAGSVKGMHWADVRAAGADLVIANTYHLMLRPGADQIAAQGGFHKFTGWNGPLLTDSGGFQVMSLSKLSKLSEEGVTFQSHVDGSKHMLTPERCMDIQHKLDTNITMVLDECTAYPATHDIAETSMLRSMRWAERCRNAFKERDGYGIFGIVQGSVFEDLRRHSAQALQTIGFDGYAVGGLAVGEGQDLMFAMLDATVPALPADKPRYLMGVGYPDDIVGAVARGIDMFDCVIPTRAGRTGRAFTSQGTLNLRNAKHAGDLAPLDPACRCPACAHTGRAYLHHLFRTEEMLGPMLLTWHNLTYYQTLMRHIRMAIEQNSFVHFANTFLSSWRAHHQNNEDLSEKPSLSHKK